MFMTICYISSLYRCNYSYDAMDDKKFKPSVKNFLFFALVCVFFLIFAENWHITMTRHRFLRLCCCVFMTALMGCSQCGNGSSPADRTDVLTTMTMQIRQCSRLYTTEYKVHKVMTVSDHSTIDASGLGINMEIEKPGYRKMVIPIDATLKGYIDFSTFSESSIERQGNQIIITLPDPEVMLTGSTVDHEHLREYVSPYRDRFSAEEKTALISQGREAIIDEIPRLGIEQSARAAAVRLLVPLISLMGYDEQDIIINFRSDFTSDQLIRHFD